MTAPLLDALRARIIADGPISVADYIRACLHDPEHGYYRTQMAIGRDGDFITAPEISQVFGELVGIWAIAAWQTMGAPDRLRFVELGPGRGTLLVDALRSFALVDGLADKMSVHCVEVSPVLRQAQADALSAFEDVQWHGRLEDVPAGPTVLVANEFLDTFPVQQFVCEAGRWRERLIGLDDQSDLTCLLSDDEQMPPYVPEGSEDGILEVMPDTEALTDALAARAKLHPFVGLFIDYGHPTTMLGETLQAVRRHQHVPVLSDPGNCDLSAHVDFQAFGAAAQASGLQVSSPMPQGAFLSGLGVIERAQKLVSGKGPDQVNEIETSVVRLVAEAGMGGRFQTMALQSAGLPIVFPFSALV